MPDRHIVPPISFSPHLILERLRNESRYGGSRRQHPQHVHLHRPHCPLALHMHVNYNLYIIETIISSLPLGAIRNQFFFLHDSRLLFRRLNHICVLWKLSRQIDDLLAELRTPVFASHCQAVWPGV